MSRIKRAGGGKRDASEADIVTVLRQLGARVYFIGGQGNPDLAIWFRDRAYLCEVKTGAGTRTKNQRTIPWPVIRTPAEGLKLIGINETYPLPWQRYTKGTD